MLSDRHCRLLTAFVDGELTPREQQKVLRMVRESSEARALLHQLRQDAEGIQQLPAATVGQDLSELVLQRIDRPIVRPRLPVSSSAVTVPVWYGLATAAAVLLTVGLGSYLYYNAAQNLQPDDTARELALVPGNPKGKAPPPPAESAPSGKIPAPAAPAQPEIRSPEIAKKTDSGEPKRSPPVAPSANDSVSAFSASTDPRKDSIPEVDVSVPFALNREEFAQENRWQQLLAELQKRPALHLDLTCREADKGVARLEAALKAQGIRLLIDADAKDRLQPLFRSGRDAPEFVLYTENVPPKQVLAILQRLTDTDKKAGEKLRGSSEFVRISAEKLGDLDRSELIQLIDVDPAQPPSASRKTATEGIDIRKPLSAKTTEQLAKSLKGQGTLRPEPGEVVIKPTDRLAILVARKPGRTRKDAREVQLFVHHRQEAGTVSSRVFLILRGSKR
jgi:hypothetical protein